MITAFENIDSEVVIEDKFVDCTQHDLVLLEHWTVNDALAKETDLEALGILFKVVLNEVHHHQSKSMDQF